MTDGGTGMEREFDILTVGRSSIDLYANEVGAPFTEIKSFAAYVGGCPTNIAVSARRLGLAWAGASQSSAAIFGSSSRATQSSSEWM